jgi:hypothetical protein
MYSQVKPVQHWQQILEQHHIMECAAFATATSVLLQQLCMHHNQANEALGAAHKPQQLQKHSSMHTAHTVPSVLP